MKTKRINEEMARLEYGERFNKVLDRGYIILINPYGSKPGLYTESHDAVQRVIDGFTPSELDKYIVELAEIVDSNGLMVTQDCICLMLKATPLQKCEAILRAVGKWDEE